MKNEDVTADSPPSDAAFGAAEYYDVVTDNEVLQHSTPAEALTWLFENRVDFEIGVTAVAEAITSYGPVKVYAFTREGYHATFGEHTAGWLVEQIEEHWLEEYGGEDSPFSQEQLDALAGKLAPIIQAFGASEPVWRCTKSAERVYSPEEALEMMRRENPSWFKEPDPAAEPGPDAALPPSGGDGLCS